MSYSIVERTAKDLIWQWDSAVPAVKVGVRWEYTRPVDPFPGYAHDKNAVDETARIATRSFPIGFPVVFYSLENELTSRINGETNQDEDYDDTNSPRQFSPWIILSGKRIPPHPALTRYLVAHEYGHVVEDWISYSRGDKDNDALREEYRKFRELGPAPLYYGGGTWHASVGEIIANDFRIVIAQTEHEYWPHPQVPYPDNRVADWWEETKSRYAFKEKIAA